MFYVRPYSTPRISAIVHVTSTSQGLKTTTIGLGGT